MFPWSGIVDENSQLSETFRVPDPQTGQMRRLTSQIEPKEEEMFRNMIRRLNHIVKTAEDLDVRIMIDAEQTYFQPAISRITLEMMRKYNKKKAIVFNTYQCYLQEAFKEVRFLAFFLNFFFNNWFCFRFVLIWNKLKDRTFTLVLNLYEELILNRKEHVLKLLDIQIQQIQTLTLQPKCIIRL